MRKLLVAGITTAVVLVAAGSVLATHNYEPGKATVSIVAKGPNNPGGNAYCPGNTIPGPKIDPGANYSDAYITVSGYDGNTFDWAFTSLGNSSAGYDMAVVIVKGGPNSAVYTYDFVENPAYDDADSDLAAPTNPKNGTDYGISHIQFCYDPKGGGDD